MANPLTLQIPARTKRLIVAVLNPKEPNQEIVVGKEGSLRLFIPLRAPRSGAYRICVILRGEGARASIFGAGVLRGSRVLYLTVDTVHEAPRTEGSTLVKAVVADRSRMEFYGMIKIKPRAQGAVDFLKQDSLLLGEEASANSVPGLEIEANEVRASHAATAAPLNPEQLFYLQSRGINKVIAEKMVSEAFLAPALAAAPRHLQRTILKGL